MKTIRIVDEMTPKERIEAVLTGKPYDRIPCNLHVSNQAGKQVGIKHWECYFSAEKTAQTQIAARKIFGVESVAAGPGLHGVAEAVGSKVFYPREENTPYITEVVVNQYSDLDALEIPNPCKKGRLPVHLETLQILVEHLGREVPVITNVAGPFTTAANIRGTENFMRDLYQNPEFVHKLLRFSLDSALEYIKAAANIGAKVSFADPTASTTLISPKQFRQFAFPYLKEIIAKTTQLVGSAPSLHICGNTKKIWRDMAETGAGLLSLDETVDLESAKQEVGALVALSGNVKPTATMFMGKPADVFVDARQCLRKAYDTPKGYVLALGCGLPMCTPDENIYALFQAAREYGRYPIEPERLN